MVELLPNTDPAPGQDQISWLTTSCVRATGVDGGGVSVVTQTGSVLLAHATDDLARRLENLQFTLGEGPSVDARALNVPILVPNLQERPSAGVGWPAFRDEAHQLGAEAVFAFPIQVGSVALGSLGLYRQAPGSLLPDQVLQGLATCTALGRSLVAPVEAQPSEQDATAYPMSVHRAAGMVTVQLDCTIEDALLRLRATAYLESRSITALAQDVLDGTRRLTSEET